MARAPETNTRPTWRPGVRSAALAAIILTGAGLCGAVAETSGHIWRRPPHAEIPSGSPPVPVTIETVRLQDVPIHIEALGTVQAFNTVTVRTRVDGELQDIAFAEGQDVEAGQVLARIDPRSFQAQLDQAKAKQAADEAQLGNARRDLDRLVRLGDYASRQSVDTQRASIEQLAATVRADQAAVENARVQLGYTTITAPIGGRTGVRLVDQGNIVHASDPSGLVVITQLQPISAMMTLPEDDLPRVAKAMAAGGVEVEALSRDAKQALDEGTVALIDNQIDQSTGTIRLKATFPNAGRTLWPGQFVKVRLQIGVDHDAVTVPPAAVQRGAAGLYAFVVKPDDTVETRPLEVARLDSNTVVVEAGLQAGERVVTAGQYRLAPGSLVTAESAVRTPIAQGTQP